MVKWKVILSSQAVKDTKKLRRAGLRPKAEFLLQLLQEDPFIRYPAYKKLVGNLNGFYSRRINIQHRLVYSVDPNQHVVHVLRMWSHYE
ncbi:MAG: Txe/YoeB family addiction module toxin [Candidatus Electrothrix sp. Rat3]|nr:Txe/YoeB family addiction module toxin [Candidatus Electrothrix rattekaaiensis]